MMKTSKALYSVTVYFKDTKTNNVVGSYQVFTDSAVKAVNHLRYMENTANSRGYIPYRGARESIDNILQYVEEIGSFTCFTAGCEVKKANGYDPNDATSIMWEYFQFMEECGDPDKTAYTRTL